MNKKTYRRIKRIRRALLVPFEWLGIVFVLGLVQLLNRRGLFCFCDFLSALMYFFDRRGKRRALQNLRIIRGSCSADEGSHLFDPDSASYAPTGAEVTVIRRSYRNMARTVGYAFWTCFRARERTAAAGVMSTECKRLLAEERPVITVSGHIGCWEILSQLAFLEGHRMMSVAKDIGTRGMTRLLMRARTSIGREIVPAEGAFKPLLQGLRDGKSLGLLVDQKVSPKKGGVWIRFLGRPMPVSAAPAFFSAKARIPVFVAWSRPLADGRYRCELVARHSADEARDIWALTQAVAEDLSRVIRRHPSCWALNYNCFSTVPDEAALAALEKRERRQDPPVAHSP